VLPLAPGTYSTGLSGDFFFAFFLRAYRIVLIAHMNNPLPRCGCTHWQPIALPLHCPMQPCYIAESHHIVLLVIASALLTFVANERS
jgi:hypothetical protein